MLELDMFIYNIVVYYICSGGYDVKEYDWKQYFKWVKVELKVK